MKERAEPIPHVHIVIPQKLLKINYSIRYPDPEPDEGRVEA